MSALQAAAFKRYEPKHWEILQPSSVEVEQVTAKTFEIIIDGELSVPVEPRSSIEGQLRLGVGRQAVIDQFKAGKFFVVDDKVVDYRMKDDLKFVHDNKSIQELIDRIGLVTPDISSRSFVGGRGRRARVMQEAVRSQRPLARSITESFECNPLDRLGGQFDINIGFNWSPFALDIESLIEMWRQICSNGAIARDPMMNNRIPMMNMWQDNMAISNQVIRHNFDKKVLPRLEALPNEVISLADLKSLRAMVGVVAGDKEMDTDSREHAENIHERLSLGWDDAADKLKLNMLKFIPAQVTAYDAMNIATEMSTHHVTGPAGAKFQAFVNGLIFDPKRQYNQSLDLDTLVTDVETFGDTDRAFFGETCH